MASDSTVVRLDNEDDDAEARRSHGGGQRDGGIRARAIRLSVD